MSPTLSFLNAQSTARAVVRKLKSIDGLLRRLRVVWPGAFIVLVFCWRGMPLGLSQEPPYYGTLPNRQENSKKTICASG